MKHQSKCQVCSKQSGRPKRLPYGGQRKKFWCFSCDCDLVNPVNKKKTRQSAKKQIQKDLDN